MEKILRRLFSNEKPMSEEFKLLNTNSLQNAPDTYFEEKRQVRVINNVEYVKNIQTDRGGWNSEIIKCCGVKCTVISVDLDKFIYIKTPSNEKWLFNRGALESIEDNHDLSNKKIKLFEAIKNDQIQALMSAIEPELLNVTNDDGMTPIYLACNNENAEFVRILCEFGVDIAIADKNGKTPIDVCFEKRNLKILQIIANSYPSILNQQIIDGKTGENILDESTSKSVEAPYYSASNSSSIKQSLQDKSINLYNELGFTLRKPPDVSLQPNSIFKETSPTKLGIDLMSFGEGDFDLPPNDSNISQDPMHLQIDIRSETTQKKI